MPPYRRPGETEGEYALFLRHAHGHYSRILPAAPHTIGRDAHVDVVVFYDWRVLPHHAVVTVEGVGLRVRATHEPSVSAAETFVDDVRVGADPTASALARVGSKLRVGDTILVVEGGAVVEQAYETWLAKRRKTRHVRVPRAMWGTLEEVPLPDLLELFGTAKKSGVLVITHDDEVGRIHMLRGLITHASVDQRDDLPAMESMLRMFEWPDGSYELDLPDLGAPATVSLRTEEVIHQALARLPKRRQ